MDLNMRVSFVKACIMVKAPYQTNKTQSYSLETLKKAVPMVTVKKREKESVLKKEIGSMDG